ncbi:hypothetical protein ACFVTY_06035 [Streptomyces sp. NPDC058067]|uniref:hypothetical protein n=1 Tax=Streptomyces sp. NPDC058067 TaxID=3346324 RepID=UPI0036EA0BCE
MEVDVLGPLVARTHGVSLVPTAAKPRQVLTDRFSPNSAGQVAKTGGTYLLADRFTLG